MCRRLPVLVRGGVCSLTLLVGVLTGAPGAGADEPLFGFVYTTDLLPKGKWEVEQWATLREEKAHGTFHLLESRHLPTQRPASGPS